MIFSLKTVTEAAIEKYSYGCCMWFALAVHDQTGWPLEVLFDGAEDSISHAYVRTPNGRSFDICGLDGADDYVGSQFSASNNPRVRQVTRDELIALSKGENNVELKQAIAVLNEFYTLEQPRASAKKIMKP